MHPAAFEGVELQSSLKSMIAANSASTSELDLAFDHFFHSYEKSSNDEWKTFARLRLLSTVGRLCKSAKNETVHDTDRTMALASVLYQLVDEAVAIGEPMSPEALTLAMMTKSPSGMQFEWHHAEKDDRIWLVNSHTRNIHYAITVFGNVAKSQSSWTHTLEARYDKSKKRGIRSLDEAKVMVYLDMQLRFAPQSLTIKKTHVQPIPLRNSSIVTRFMRMFSPT